jgi:hypothetical protein
MTEKKPVAPGIGTVPLTGRVSVYFAPTGTPAPLNVQIVTQAIQADPCGVLGHQMGMLVRGGTECTRCGRRGF